MTKQQAPTRSTRKPHNALTVQIRKVNQAHDELDELDTATVTLANLGRLRAQLSRAIDAAIIRARFEGSYWPEIGAALGMSPQAVQQRYQLLTATPSAA